MLTGMSDFRSDTVTRPTPAMREAMVQAEVGDDVYGEDPTVNALEQRAAQLLGFEAAVFASSGTQSNLIGLLAHCERGDEAIVGQQWHTYRWEAGGMAVLGSIQPQPLEHAPDATIPLAAIEAAIKPDDAHFARTRLICLENTTGGTVLPMDYLRDVRTLAERYTLRTHLDGARLFNAATEIARRRTAGDRTGDGRGSPATGVREVAREIASNFDTVSVCLSKGLGAPVGSVLVGSSALIARARRWRKMLGGGMRQAGLLAAAGLYALDHHIDRLADDHRRASALAEGLQRIGARHGGLIRARTPHSNIVFVEIDASIAGELGPWLKSRDVRVNTRIAYGGPSVQRWVTHLDLDDAAVSGALEVVEQFFRR
jgi:threonine aldolase